MYKAFLKVIKEDEGEKVILAFGKKKNYDIIRVVGVNKPNEKRMIDVNRVKREIEILNGENLTTIF